MQHHTYEQLPNATLLIHRSPTVYHYRDNTDMEIDAIVQTVDGRWAAFEVKLGQARIDSAAQTLKKFAERIDTAKSGKPATLGVIVTGGYGHRREDGIAVIPIGALAQ